ncbi:MAG TPA: sulfotransferase family 2 domain-containing protein [Rhizomicrobium sp.]|nr:sulfotransferase family 2 domain-containing protein [Rhizomicrobium sp.]
MHDCNNRPGVVALIISHRHKFIFFAVPKTGTHSVRQALRTHMGQEDLEQVGLFVRKRFPFPEFRDITHGHISVQQIRGVLGEEIFADYFKFAFVRNPFDRFVSYCAFLGREGAFAADPKGYMRAVIAGARPPYRLLFLPQSDFLVDARGRLAMDFVGRTEDMQASYDAICARIGIPTADLGRVNASRHDRYDTYLDPAMRRWISDFYVRDFAMFDYQRDAYAAQST